MRLPTYQRDVLLAAKINEPVAHPDLRAAVGGIEGRTGRSHFETVLSDLREAGLLAHESRGGGPGNPAVYRLTDAGRERVEALQGLLWDVATS